MAPSYNNRLWQASLLFWASIALLVNEPLLTLLFSQDGVIASSHKRFIWSFQAAATGFLLLCYFRPKLGLQLSLSSLAILLSLGCLELHLRLRRWDHTTVRLDRLHLRIPDSEYHHTLAPMVSGRAIWGSYHFTYHTNSLGYRSSSNHIVARKNPLETRVLFAGDSLVEGLGLNYESTFIGHLEALFRDQGYPVELLNAGVSSYYPVLSLKKAQRFFTEGYTTDILVQFLDVSDPEDAVSPEWYGNWTHYTEEEMRRFEVERAEKIRNVEEQIESERRFRLIYPRILCLLRDTKPEQHYPTERLPFRDPFRHLLENHRFSWPCHDPKDPRFEWVKQGLDICCDSILAMRDLCIANQTEYVLVIYPHPAQLIEPKETFYEAHMLEFAEKNNIKMINLFSPFYQLKNWRKYFIAGDIHWNKHGHRFVAQQIYADLVDLVRNNSSSIPTKSDTISVYLSPQTAP